MYAALLAEYEKIEWTQVADPVLEDDEVLIRVKYAGICGSDLHIYLGDFAPRTVLPLIPGHEFSGRVERVGNQVTNVAPGDRVVVDPAIPCGTCAACRRGFVSACPSLKLLGVDTHGAFAQFVKVKDSMVHRLGESISDRHAALVELYSIGFHACLQSDLQRGDRVAIWGAGRVGQSILQAARTQTDGPIFIVDVLDSRLELAAKVRGPIVPINAHRHDPFAIIAEGTDGDGVDVAFEAVGHPRQVANVPHPVVACVHAIRGAGTVCVLGLGDEPVSMVMKDIIWKEARLVSSRVNRGEFPLVLDHLERGLLEPEIIISAEIPMHEAHRAFSLLLDHPENYLKILLVGPQEKSIL